MDGDTRILNRADGESQERLKASLDEASRSEPVPTPAAASIAAPAGVEAVKLASRQLRGTIAQTLADDTTDRFSEDDYNLLKFHGVYQQYDRDTATPRKQQGLDKEYSVMARTRVPGGRLTPDQYLALDALGERLANGSIRVTTRQTIQFHGVLKGHLPSLMAEVDEALLTCFAACGDVVRNVMATPAPIKDAVHDTLNRVAAEISSHLLPKTDAYHEIWVDGAKVERPGAKKATMKRYRKKAEPIYGDSYLPRKFKIAIATPDDNSTDVLTNDVGIIALFDGDRLEGYTIAVGGGLGMTHNKPKTYPRLATPLLFVEPDGLLGAIEAIVKVQRDYGDRTDRRHARLKYTIDDRGIGWMRDAVETAAGRRYEDPRPLPRFRIADHMGWHDQKDGKLYLGVPVPSGRITGTLRDAFWDVVTHYRPTIILAPSQDIIFGNIEPEDRDGVEAMLREHGVVLAQDLKPIQRWSLACPALPTCGLALTEAERIRQPVVDAVLAKLEARGLDRETISLRITGCPNGCARPYAGDIGLVGRMPGHFALYVGGDFEGTRLNFRLLDKVAEDEVPEMLDILFAAFAENRQSIESFGDFCNRWGLERLIGAIDAAMPAVTI